jgi:hypothetical protein
MRQMKIMTGCGKWELFLISWEPKKLKRFVIKIYMLWYSKGYTWNMSVYLGRDKCVTATVTRVHATMSGLTIRIGNLGHKLYRDSFFSSDLLNDLHTEAIHSCSTVRPKWKVMQSVFGRKLRLKCGNIKTRVKGDCSCSMEGQVKQTYWWVCIVLQQKVMSALSMEMLWNQQLYKWPHDKQALH